MHDRVIIRTAIISFNKPVFAVMSLNSNNKSNNKRFILSVCVHRFVLKNIMHVTKTQYINQVYSRYTILYQKKQKDASLCNRLRRLYYYI